MRSVSQLCRGLAGLGHEVTVFTTDSGGDRRMAVPVNEPVEVGGVTVYYFKTDFTPKYGYSRALRKACQEQVKNFNILHLTSLWWYPSIAAGNAARKHEIPYVISTTGGLIEYSLMQKHLKKRLYLALIEKRNFQHAAAIRYTAELERKQSADYKISAPSFIVPNGISAKEFDNFLEKSQMRKDLGIPLESQVVLYLGRLHARKGLDFLIKAIAIVKDRMPDILLVLAGPDDGHEALLKNLARQLRVESKVLFKGYISPEKRTSLLRMSDICALVTHPGENFGNAAVEAMLAGVPVLVSDNVGICREVAEDEAGRVVPLEVGAIAGAIEQMLANPEGLRAMGEAAAASARRRYDLDIVARQMATAYEDILTGRRSPGLSWSDA